MEILVQFEAAAEVLDHRHSPGLNIRDVILPARRARRRRPASLHLRQSRAAPGVILCEPLGAGTA
jgi:hypothetical protein